MVWPLSERERTVIPAQNPKHSPRNPCLFVFPETNKGELHSPLHGWSSSIIHIGTSGLKVTAFHFLSFHSASQTTHSWEKDHGPTTFAQHQRHMEKLHSQHKICYFSVGIGIKSFSGVYFTHICFLACPVTFCASWSKAPCLSFLNHWEHSRKIIGVIHGGTRSPVGSGTRGMVKRCSWI